MAYAADGFSMSHNWNFLALLLGIGACVLIAQGKGWYERYKSGAPKVDNPSPPPPRGEGVPAQPQVAPPLGAPTTPPLPQAPPPAWGAPTSPWGAPQPPAVPPSRSWGGIDMGNGNSGDPWAQNAPTYPVQSPPPQVYRPGP